jgi:WD40 repeat protein
MVYAHTNVIYRVAYDPTGNHLTSASWDNTIKIWSSQAPYHLLHTLQAHGEWVANLAYSPNGEYLASIGNDNTLHIWDVKNDYQLLYTNTLHDPTQFIRRSNEYALQRYQANNDKEEDDEKKEEETPLYEGTPNIVWIDNARLLFTNGQDGINSGDFLDQTFTTTFTGSYLQSDVSSAPLKGANFKNTTGLTARQQSFIEENGGQIPE